MKNFIFAIFINLFCIALFIEDSIADTFLTVTRHDNNISVAFSVYDPNYNQASKELNTLNHDLIYLRVKKEQQKELSTIQFFTRNIEKPVIDIVTDDANSLGSKIQIDNISYHNTAPYHFIQNQLTISLKKHAIEFYTTHEEATLADSKNSINAKKDVNSNDEKTIQKKNLIIRNKENDSSIRMDSELILEDPLESNSNIIARRGLFQFAFNTKPSSLDTRASETTEFIEFRTRNFDNPEDHTEARIGYYETDVNGNKNLISRIDVPVGVFFWYPGLVYHQPDVNLDDNTTNNDSDNLSSLSYLSYLDQQGIKPTSCSFHVVSGVANRYHKYESMKDLCFNENVDYDPHYKDMLMGWDINIGDWTKITPDENVNVFEETFNQNVVLPRLSHYDPDDNRFVKDSFIIKNLDPAMKKILFNLDNYGDKVQNRAPGYKKPQQEFYLSIFGGAFLDKDDGYWRIDSPPINMYNMAISGMSLQDGHSIDNILNYTYEKEDPSFTCTINSNSDAYIQECLKMPVINYCYFKSNDSTNKNDYCYVLNPFDNDNKIDYGLKTSTGIQDKFLLYGVDKHRHAYSLNAGKIVMNKKDNNNINNDFFNSSHSVPFSNNYIMGHSYDDVTGNVFYMFYERYSRFDINSPIYDIDMTTTAKVSDNINTYSVTNLPTSHQNPNNCKNANSNYEFNKMTNVILKRYSDQKQYCEIDLYQDYIRRLEDDIMQYDENGNQDKKKAQRLYYIHLMMLLKTQ